MFPASGSQGAGITDMSQHTWLVKSEEIPAFWCNPGHRETEAEDLAHGQSELRNEFWTSLGYTAGLF